MISNVNSRRSRTPAEGEQTGHQSTELAPAAHADFIPGQPQLNQEISRLHAELAHDDFAQTKIDRHLLAAGAAWRSVDLGFPLKLLVLSQQDTPQYSALPDLGPVLRSCLVSRKWGENLLHYCLHSCLPIPKSTVKAPLPDPRSCAILLNILLATLLGLYPNTTKRPPFVVRAKLFSRVHALLTANYEAQYNFATKHVDLLVFSLGEYICRLLPALFPAEYLAICGAQTVESFFLQGPGIFEFFRQDTLDHGEEPWHKLCFAARESHDKLCRMYRSKCRLPSQQKRLQPCEASFNLLSAAMKSPQIVTYPCHKAQEKLLGNEYAILLESDNMSDVAAIHSLVKTAPLPASIAEEQVGSCLI